MSYRLVAPENDYGELDANVVEGPRLRVAVVIPVFNRVDLLARTIGGVAAQTYPPHLLQVVVADDGSDEQVEAALHGIQETIDIRIVRRDHVGYGAGQARNLGASVTSDADLLVFFDADCIPDTDAVIRHAAWHHLASNLVVIGSRHHIDTTGTTPDAIVDDPLRLRELAFESRTPDDQRWESDDFRAVLHRRTSSLRYGDEGFRSLVSSNFSVMNAEFRDAGGFSPGFTRWGGEDTELGWRLWNSAAYFVAEPRAAVYHQRQTDTGPEGWRQKERHSNDGIIQTKIPHRFYRSEINAINETPKVSVIVHSQVGRLPEIADQVLGQRLGDVEVVVSGETPEVSTFMERRAGDSRFKAAATPEQAIALASGEFIALLHGSAAPDHRLLSRSVAAIERRPRLGWVRSAYGVQRASGIDVYRSERDLRELDGDWGELPVFFMTRRRDLMKTVRSGSSAADAVTWASSSLTGTTHGTALVWLPNVRSGESEVTAVRPPRTLRSEVLDDLRAGGRRALTSPLRVIKTVARGGPASPGVTKPQVASPGDRPPVIRYVGWTGRNNLGDEAMLLATERLFGWADLTTDGDSGDVLMLGGGTLINRGYLRILRPLDSPRRERIVFGTGVANPSYWGAPKEKPDEWIAFLETCAYVGVRGPTSADLLHGWGLKRDVEVVGDPALSLEASAGVARVDGRVVVCPAWARGLLWGEDDESVITAFAATVRSLREAGHDVWVLSAFPADDSHIISMMRQANAADLPYLSGHEDTQAAIDLLASAGLVVAERLHAAVLAASVGAVPVMVEYRPKLRDFGRSIALEDLVIRTDQVSGGALESLVKDALQERESLAGRMAVEVARYRSLQQTAAGHLSSIVRE